MAKVTLKNLFPGTKNEYLQIHEQKSHVFQYSYIVLTILSYMKTFVVVIISCDIINITGFEAQKISQFL